MCVPICSICSKFQIDLLSAFKIKIWQIRWYHLVCFLRAYVDEILFSSRAYLITTKHFRSLATCTTWEWESMSNAHRKTKSAFWNNKDMLVMKTSQGPIFICWRFAQGAKMWRIRTDLQEQSMWRNINAICGDAVEEQHGQHKIRNLCATTIQNGEGIKGIIIGRD